MFDEIAFCDLPRFSGMVNPPNRCSLGTEKPLNMAVVQGLPFVRFNASDKEKGPYQLPLVEAPLFSFASLALSQRAWQEQGQDHREREPVAQGAWQVLCRWQ